MSTTLSHLAASFLGHQVFIETQLLEQLPESRTSRLGLGLYIQNNSSTTLAVKGPSSLGLDTEGNAQKRTFPTVSAPPGKTWLTRDLEVAVRHQADGTATGIPITWSWGVNAGTNSTSGTVYVDLPSLDLVSSPTVSRFYCPIGQSVVIETNPAKDTLTHTLSYTLDDQTGLIAQNVGRQYVWTLPETLLPALKDFPQDTCTITCQTYEGSTLLGSKSCNFIVQAGSAGAIETQEGWCTFSPKSDNQLLQSWGIYVDGYTRVQATVDATKVTYSPGAQAGSAVLAVNGRQYTDPFISHVLEGTYGHTAVLTLTDSRSTSCSYTQTITPLPYNPPTLGALECYRCDGQGEADQGGNYLSVAFTPVFSSLGGHNSVRVELRLYSASDQLLSTLAVTESGVYFGSLDPQKAYRLQVCITDALEESGSISYLLPSQQVTFQLKEGGDGAAFGGLAEDSDCLAVHWSRLKLGGQDLADFPIRTGTQGLWQYTLWKSGYVQCQATLTGTLTTNQNWGSFYSTQALSLAYPLTFAQVPRVQVTPRYGGRTDYFLRTANSGGSVTVSPAYALVTPTNETIQYVLDLSVEGMAGNIQALLAQ